MPSAILSYVGMVYASGSGSIKHARLLICAIFTGLAWIVRAQVDAADGMFSPGYA